MNIEVERRSRNLLLIAMARILKPLVRLLLEYDIKYTMVLEELKRVYVTVADEEFKLANGEQTDSRITLLTGVHRKDVKRIRSEESGLIAKEPRRLSLTSQLIALWLRNPEHLDNEGNPIPLPKLISAGGDHSFEALVAKISKDIRARPVLDEWLNLGLVTLDENDYVHLNMQAFIPSQNLEEKLFYLSMNVHDHLATAVNNIQPNNTPFLERCIYYYNLTGENIDTLHTAARELGMESLTKLNRLAMDLKAAQKADTTISKDQVLKRMNFGMYFHSSSEMIESESESVKAATTQNATSGPNNQTPESK
jgi:hypothetical protein